MTKAKMMEELKALGVEVSESFADMTKEEMEEVLKEARAKSAPSEPQEEEKPTQSSDADAEEVVAKPVLIGSKGKFSLFGVNGGYEIKTQFGQLISSGKNMDEGSKLLSDLAR